MAIGYTWDVSNVDTYPNKNGKSNVVHNVHWRLTAKDDTNKDSDGNNWTATAYGAQSLDICRAPAGALQISTQPWTATAYGAQSLDISDLSSFILWSNLKASDVQGWVESALGSEKVTEIKTGLDADISEKISPSSIIKTLTS